LAESRKNRIESNQSTDDGQISAKKPGNLVGDDRTRTSLKPRFDCIFKVRNKTKQNKPQATMLETSIRFLARRAGNRASALVAPAVFTTRRVGSTLVAASSSSFGAETDITTLDLLFHKIDMIECHVAGLNFHDGRRLFEQMINIESEVADLQRSMADACTQLALMTTTTSYGESVITTTMMTVWKRSD
jgi:hypothetical protein